MIKKWDLLYELGADAIATDVERRSVEGTITEANRVRMGDRPAFRMRTEDGAEVVGTRRGDPSRYVEGLRLRLEYVTLERAADATSGFDAPADVIVAVWIEHSHRRTPYVHSFSASPPSPI